MRKAAVYFNGELAGYLIQENESLYTFEYLSDYHGSAISLTMPTSIQIYFFYTFPPFFDGLLPEGSMLDALLKNAKIDRYDYFSQLLHVGEDLVGAVTVKECQ